MSDQILPKLKEKKIVEPWSVSGSLWWLQQLRTRFESSLEPASQTRKLWFVIHTGPRSWYSPRFPAKPMNQYTSLQIIGTKQILCGHWFCLKTSLGCSGLVHGDDPEGWDGEGGGRGGSRRGKHVNPWLIHVNVWQKPLQYCKIISLQLITIIGGKKKQPHLVLDTRLSYKQPINQRFIKLVLLRLEGGWV